MAMPESGRLTINGLSLCYIEAGRGPLLLCLHGFPDHAPSFRHQISAFAALGYHVVVPYMRGYAPSDILPHGPYQSAALALDVIGLIDMLGGGRADIIGHDWGAVAAYGAAVIAPQKIGKLVALSIPYGPSLAKALVTDATQQRRSWYMFFFLSPFAEAALAHNDFEFLDRIWSDWSPGWHNAPEAMAALKATFRVPGVVKASLDYYRAAFDSTRRDPDLAPLQAKLGAQPVSVPTLYLHGANDGCVSPHIASDLAPLFPAGLKREIVASAGHFLHLERPDAVNALIAGFLDRRRQ
jgi:pimeloyl-ACP methyl ester carboxylesterase